MTDLVVAGAALLLAAGPCLLFWRNLALYRSPPLPAEGEPPAVSVLIPARNEERAIAAAVESALASRGVSVEVVVLDDGSEDRTGEVVGELARRDGRVRLAAGAPLPAGWCGKQHACWLLAGQARHDLLLFLDADVRLEPDGLARLVGFLRSSGADLVSGVPWQETGTFLEKLLLPLIHFVLLGFLPVDRMRRFTDPGYAAGCGQLFLARRVGYDAAGGHAAIRATLHDGILLPRAFRRAGRRTDLCDATDLARCRMYRGAAEVWRGLAKNATEGLGAPAVIVPMTVLLGGGQVLPFALAVAGPWLGMSPVALGLAALATAASYLPRVAGAVRFRQSWLGAALHPPGVAVLLAVQWYALGRALVGRPSTWRGRTYRPAGRVVG